MTVKIQQFYYILLLQIRSNVKSVLLHGSETWKVAKITTSKLQVFVNRCLRRILNIYWPEVISNEELWRRAEETEISIEINL